MKDGAMAVNHDLFMLMQQNKAANFRRKIKSGMKVMFQLLFSFLVLKRNLYIHDNMYMETVVHGVCLMLSLGTHLREGTSSHASHVCVPG